MTTAPRGPLALLRRSYDSGHTLALLFDYDGTLAPIASHPRQARIPDDTRRHLRRLASVPRVHLGVVSGRHLADLRRMVDMPGLFLAGTSGLELDFAGVQVTHPQAGRWTAELARLNRLLTPLLPGFPGAWLESKPVGLTLHYRAVPLPLISSLRDRALRMLAAFADRFRVVESAMSLEIVPELGWNKGTAVQMIVDSIPSDNVLVLYAGDSANDSLAMDVVASLGGITMGIGLEAPHGVQFHMKRREELIEMLARFAACISSTAALRVDQHARHAFNLGN